MVQSEILKNVYTERRCPSWSIYLSFKLFSQHKLYFPILINLKISDLLLNCTVFCSARGWLGLHHDPNLQSALQRRYRRCVSRYPQEVVRHAYVYLNSHFLVSMTSSVSLYIVSYDVTLFHNLVTMICLLSHLASDLQCRRDIPRRPGRRPHRTRRLLP